MKKKFNQGVTLVELIVVIFIISMLGGLIGMRLNFSGFSIHSAAAQLEMHLWQVKQLALTTRQNIGLQFNSSNKEYRGISIPIETGQKDPFAKQPLEAKLKINSINTTMNDDIILFDLLGRPVNRQNQVYETSCVITLQSGSKIETITIEPLTGYIHN